MIMVNKKNRSEKRNRKNRDERSEKRNRKNNKKSIMNYESRIKKNILSF